MSPIPSIITDLVNKFERNIHEYNPKYNETLSRIEFGNPFWIAIHAKIGNKILLNLLKKLDVRASCKNVTV